MLALNLPSVEDSSTVLEDMLNSYIHPPLTKEQFDETKKLFDELISLCERAKQDRLIEGAMAGLLRSVVVGDYVVANVETNQTH